MPSITSLIPRALRSKGALALIAAAGLIGCFDSASPTAPSAAQTDGTNALQEQPAHHPGVPAGCSLEYAGEGRDSVLNCPDIRPPKPG